MPKAVRFMCLEIHKISDINKIFIIIWGSGMFFSPTIGKSGQFISYLYIIVCYFMFFEEINLFMSEGFSSTSVFYHIIV